MGIIELFILAIGLSMDAFTVAICIVLVLIGLRILLEHLNVINFR